MGLTLSVARPRLSPSSPLTQATRMMAIVANAVKHTTTTTTTTAAASAVLSSRPSRAAATAARTALNNRSRSPSSSLSPLPPSPRADLYDPAADALGSPGDVPRGASASKDDDESEVVEPPPKKKRTRKPKEPIVYTIPDVEQLTTNFKCVPRSPRSSSGSRSEG